ncbi:hypothetical protein CL633_03825 [bacterium]|nr:hypothetical protein [bacterium]|tara:strand:+ start:10481 stop:11476 length:996 start_codon:yes stop_codon:yes gene_type:complete
MILDSIRPVITSGLEHIKIRQDKIPGFIQEYGADISKFDISRWLYLTPNRLSAPSRIPNLIFLFNTINFCYWPDKDEKQRWTVPHQETDEKLTSSEALWYCLACNKEKGISYTPEYLANLSLASLQKNLKGNHGKIPLIQERLQILNSLGQSILNNKWSFAESLSESIEEKSAMHFIMGLLSYCGNCFEDWTWIYQINIGSMFLKRAQLICHMLWMYYWTKYNISIWDDVQELTICADYKIPQIMRHFGLLEYSKELAPLVDNKIEIPAKSRMEVEIRSATIWLGELIKQEFHKQGQTKVNAIHVDDWFWRTARKIENTMLPHHRTITAWY